MSNIFPKKLFSKKTRDANKKAFQAFGIYQKTVSLIERTNIAIGRKNSYTSSQKSTSNFECNLNDISSTQKISNNSGLV